MKVDGRTLRKDIKNYLKEVHGVSPYFTVRSIEKKGNLCKKDEHILEVRFDELDSDLLVWEPVADWVINSWWPQNKNKVTMSKKVWSGRFLSSVSTEVKVDRVEVGYGFTH